MALTFAQILEDLKKILSSSKTDKKNKTIKEIRKLLKKRQLQREKLIQLLKQLADKLHIQHRRLNIAKTGFASGGVAGGIVSIVGFGLAPVTFGASLIVSAIGGGIMVASGTGGLSSFIAEKVIIRKLWKKVDAEIKKQVQTEMEICEVVKTLAKGGFQAAGIGGGIYGVIAKGFQLADVIGDVNTVIGGVGTAAKTVKTGTATAKSLVATLTTTGGRVLHYGGFVFTLAGMAVDIYTIVQTSKDIHKDSPCDAENQLRALIASLEEEDDDIGGI